MHDSRVALNVFCNFLIIKIFFFLTTNNNGYFGSYSGSNSKSNLQNSS